MLGDGVGKEVWLIKSRADLVSDVTWVVLQDGTKYAPFVASRDLNWHLIRHEGKGIMAKILFQYPSTPGAYRVGTGTQQRMASCDFRSSNWHCPERHSQQSEYTPEGRIHGRSGGHVSLRIRSTF